MAGSGRSGTTWVGNVLASCRGGVPVFEPLKRSRCPAVPLSAEAAEFPGRYLRLNAAHEDWRRYFEQVLSGRIANIWTRQDWTRVPQWAEGKPLLGRLFYRVARLRDEISASAVLSAL